MIVATKSRVAKCKPFTSFTIEESKLWKNYFFCSQTSESCEVCSKLSSFYTTPSQKNSYGIVFDLRPSRYISFNARLLYGRGQLRFSFQPLRLRRIMVKLYLKVAVSWFNPIKNIRYTDFSFLRCDNFQQSFFGTISVSGRLLNDNNNFRVSDFLNILFRLLALTTKQKFRYFNKKGNLDFFTDSCKCFDTWSLTYTLCTKT